MLIVSSAFVFLGSIYYYFFKNGFFYLGDSKEDEYDDLDHFEEEDNSRSYVSLQPSDAEDYLDGDEEDHLSEEDLHALDVIEDDTSEEQEIVSTDTANEQSSTPSSEERLDETSETFTEEYLS